MGANIFKENVLIDSTTAYCPLPTAYCLLPIAYCLLPIAYCPLPSCK